jgi:hypothetical protein
LAKWLNKANQKPPARPAVPPRPPKPRLDDPIANEVEEFLRRAAQARQSGEKKAERRAAQPARPILAEPMPSKSPGGVLRGKAVEVVRERAPATPSPGEPALGDEVGQHVKTFLNEDAFAKRAQQLGTEVTQIDTQIDQHLHQTFDHALGKLATVPGEAAVAPTAVEPEGEAITIAAAVSPANLFFALSDPDSIRQAIVLNEILRRPEERWA